MDNGIKSKTREAIMHTESEIKRYKKAFLRIFNRTGDHAEAARLASLPRTKTCKCGQVFHKKSKESWESWDNRKYHSLKCTGVYKRASDEENKIIINLYTKENKSLAEIGRIFGVSHGAIKQRLIYCGVEIRKTRRSKADRIIYSKINEIKSLKDQWLVRALHNWR